VFLHLGNDVTVRTSDVIGVFDMDTATAAQSTRDFLQGQEKASRVTDVSEELPKSFALCWHGGAPHVFLCAVSPATLKKRAETRKIANR